MNTKLKNIFQKTILALVLASAGAGLYGCTCDEGFDLLNLGSETFIADCLSGISATYTTTDNNIDPFNKPVERDGVDTEARFLILSHSNPKCDDLEITSVSMERANDLHIGGVQDSTGASISLPVQFKSGMQIRIQIVAGPSSVDGLQSNMVQIDYELRRRNEKGTGKYPTSAWFVDSTTLCGNSFSENPSSYNKYVRQDLTVTEQLGVDFSFDPAKCPELKYVARLNELSDVARLLTVQSDPVIQSLSTTPFTAKFVAFNHFPLGGPSTLFAHYIFSSLDASGATTYFSRVPATGFEGTFTVSNVDLCVTSRAFSTTPSPGSIVFSPPTLGPILGSISYDPTVPGASACIGRDYTVADRPVLPVVGGAALLNINFVSPPSLTGTLGTQPLQFDFSATVGSWLPSGARRDEHFVELTLSGPSVVAASVDVIASSIIDPCIGGIVANPTPVVLSGFVTGPDVIKDLNLNAGPGCPGGSFNALIEWETVAAPQTTTVPTIPIASIAIGSAPAAPTAITFKLDPTTVLSPVVRNLKVTNIDTGAFATIPVSVTVTQNACVNGLRARTAVDPIIATIGGVAQSSDVIFENISTNPACSAIDFQVLSQSGTLSGGAIIDAQPYSHFGLAVGQSDTAPSLARVTPGTTVETGMLLVAVNYGFAGSGQLAEVATLIINADIQQSTAWLACVVNKVNAQVMPDATPSAVARGAAVYRDIIFSGVPAACTMGVDISWPAQSEVSTPAGSNLSINAGNIHLAFGQSLTIPRAIALSGSVVTTLNLPLSFTVRPSAPGATSWIIRNDVIGTITTGVASCNITSPVTGSTVTGNVPVDFNVDVPSGVVNYTVRYLFAGTGGAAFHPSTGVATPAVGANPVLGVPDGTQAFSWNTVADSLGTTGREQAVIQITAVDATTSQLRASCAAQIQVINSAVPACRPISTVCGDVDNIGSVTITDALLVAQIATPSIPLPSDVICSDNLNVFKRCLLADVDQNGVVTGTIPVVPGMTTDSGRIAAYTSGIGQLACSNFGEILDDSQTLPLNCFDRLSPVPACLVVPETIRDADLVQRGIRVYVTNRSTSDNITVITMPDNTISPTAIFRIMDVIDPAGIRWAGSVPISTPIDIKLRSTAPSLPVDLPATIMVLINDTFCYGSVRVTP